MVAGMVLAGPLVCGASQAMNDWCDRHVDAINQPERPIPSGRLPGRSGFYVAVAASLVSLGYAALLGQLVLIAAALALLSGWAYSAPPLRLKTSGWWGPGLTGLSYEGLAWITGALVVGHDATLGAPHLVLFALLYSLGAHGIMTLNDFKAIDGDRRMGIASLPVTLGVPRAARVACAIMLVPQLVVATVLLADRMPIRAAAIAALVLGQGLLMRRFPARSGALGNVVQRHRRGAVRDGHDGRRLCDPQRSGGVSAPADRGFLDWGGIVRLGLVQAAIGAVVVLTTSTLNRVMVIELHLAASVPGLLVGLHYALQMLRPRWGHGADVGASRVPWIVGGVALLSVGGALAACATALMASSFWPGIALAALGFVLIGIGVGAGGTALLTLLADGVAPERRAPAASIVWIMMIIGFIATTIVASIVLRGFSFARLVELSCGVSAVAVLVTLAATWRIDAGITLVAPDARAPFRIALRTVWADEVARRFAVFIFVSMLAYSAQDLILEPFAGIVFGFTPAQTTALTSLQNGGVLAGMIAVAVVGRYVGGGEVAGMRRITLAGCAMSAVSLAGIAIAGGGGIEPMIRPAIVALGFSNGVFAISAVGLMMTLAGPRDGAGVRMGVWGAAQAVAFGGGGFAGTLAVDGARLALGATVPAYAMVFGVEAALFVAAATMMRARTGERQWSARPALAAG